MPELLYLPPGKTVRIRPDLSEYPIRIEMPRDRRLAIIILAFVCIWGAIGTVGTFSIPAVLTASTSGLWKLLPYMLALASSIAVLYFGWLAMRLYVSNDTILLYDDHLVLTTYTLFHKMHKTMRFDEFLGVRSREVSSGEGESARTYQLIELVHRDEKHTLPVYLQKSSHPPKDLLLDYARRFKLPGM